MEESFDLNETLSDPLGLGDLRKGALRRDELLYEVDS